MELNKNTMRKLLLLIAFAIVLFWGVENMDEAGRILQTAIGLVAPFLLGLAMAFVINVPMHAIETRLFPQRRGKHAALLQRLARPLSMLAAFLFIIGILWVVIFLVVPELGKTVNSIRLAIPGFLQTLQQWLQQLAERFPSFQQDIMALDVDWESISKSVFQFLRTGATSVLTSTVSIANSVFSGVFNFVLGLVFCIYALLQKEKLASQCKKLLYAWLPEQRADAVVRVGALSSKTFSSFITGQCVEAVILGAMFFVAMVAFFPYALMISVLIAFTALIPVFGAFIGCFVGAFMILMVNPVKAFWFILLFLVLQQIEGNLIYPRVVGSSVGLPAIWVLLAVTVGGSAAGVLGMLVGVPLASVAYALLRENCAARLAKNGVPPRKWKLERK